MARCGKQRGHTSALAGRQPIGGKAREKRSASNVLASPEARREARATVYPAPQRRLETAFAP
jgi:hypothetical protein